MATKARRQQRIRELIATRTPASHGELLEWLAAGGIRITQATLSRDLHELGVAKGPGGYVLPGEGAPANGNGKSDGHELARVLRAELLAADCGEHTIVLRTSPGKANAVAVEIDRARATVPEALGTVAGDDTIIVVTRSAAKAKALVRRLARLAELN